MKSRDYNSVDWGRVFYEDSSSPSGLRWRINCGSRAKAGSVAGSIWTSKKSGHQCFRVQFNKTEWLVHRVLWIMWNGEIDASLAVDHIDGDALNNSVDNIRLVSTTVNNRNHKQQKNNSSGVTGVCFWTHRSGTTYAVARWYNLAGEEERKQFSCKKLDKDLAFRKACEYRQQMIEQLNNTSGAGYSDRHGN